MSRSILGIDVDEIVKRVLSETFPTSNEKEIQDAKAAELKQMKSSSSKKKDETKEDIDEDEQEKTEVKAAEVVALFNQMRTI